MTESLFAFFGLFSQVSFIFATQLENSVLMVVS